MKAAKLLLIVLLVTGLLWLRSSYGKFTSGTFVSSLAGILTKVADKNPYPWFKQFLVNTAIPNSQIFGFLILWGEFLIAVVMSVGVLVLLLTPKPNKLVNLMLLVSLIGGAFLNILFWLGFGYTSPSTDGLNLLMLAVEIIGIFYLLPKRST